MARRRVCPQREVMRSQASAAWLRYSFQEARADHSKAAGLRIFEYSQFVSLLAKLTAPPSPNPLPLECPTTTTRPTGLAQLQKRPNRLSGSQTGS